MVRHSNGIPKDISIWFFGTHTKTQSPYRRKCNSISMFSSVEQICNFNYRNWLGKLCWLKSKVRHRQIQHAMPSLTVDNLFEMLERCNWIIYICYHKWAVHKIQSGQSLYGSELAIRMVKEFACLLTCSLRLPVCVKLAHSQQLSHGNQSSWVFCHQSELVKANWNCISDMVLCVNVDAYVLHRGLIWKISNKCPRTAIRKSKFAVNKRKKHSYWWRET